MAKKKTPTAKTTTEEVKPAPVKEPVKKAEESKPEPKKAEPVQESKPEGKSYRLQCPICKSGAEIVASTFRAYFGKCVKCSHSFKQGRELGFPSQGV